MDPKSMSEDELARAIVAEWCVLRGKHAASERAQYLAKRGDREEAVMVCSHDMTAPRELMGLLDALAAKRIERGADRKSG